MAGLFGEFYHMRTNGAFRLTRRGGNGTMEAETKGGGTNAWRASNGIPCFPQGAKTGRKSGSVRFEPDTIGNIQSEAVSMSSKVTSNPIENGADINDHVVKDPVKFSISGTIIGGQQGQQTLQTMRDRRDIVTYTGRVRIANLVITSLSFDYGAKNAKGCTFKVSFQQVNISSSEVVEVGAMPMMTQQDTGKPTSYSTAQTKKTSSDGLKTTVSETISSSAYAAYVNSYNSKPASSSGPATRATASYNGVS